MNLVIEIFAIMSQMKLFSFSVW